MKLTDVLDKPEHWTKRKLARNEIGREVSAFNPTACSWCLVGAARKVVGPKGAVDAVFHAVADAIAELFPSLPRWEFSNFNDAAERTFAEVYAVCVRADQILAEKGE